MNTIVFGTNLYTTACLFSNEILDKQINLINKILNMKSVDIEDIDSAFTRWYLWSKDEKKNELFMLYYSIILLREYKKRHKINHKKYDDTMKLVNEFPKESLNFVDLEELNFPNVEFSEGTYG